jgi:hypothetical protein
MSFIIAYSIETRRFVVRAYSQAASTASCTDQRVLIGTSSLRSSSSGACNDRASVTGMPASVSCRIRGTSPTVLTVMLRADMPRPSGALDTIRRTDPMTAL